LSSAAFENRGNRRPDRGKKKKNPSEEFESLGEEDEASYDGGKFILI